MHATTLCPSPSPTATSPHRAGESCAVILATGPDDGGKRATLAFAAACTAQAMDVDTIVFLLGDGAHWAYDGRADLVHAPGFPALADLIDAFVDAGGQLLLCSACEAACAQPGRRRDDVSVRGLASLLSHTMRGSAVTF